MPSPRRMLLWMLLLSAALSWCAARPAPTNAPFADGALAARRGGTCLDCHRGIEEIHPGFSLTCVDCHGGDDRATSKERAHVLPRQTPPGDERVLPETWDLPWQRFVNPSNLRVAEQACGTCHERLVDHVKKSLHATTAGHLGDGYYEHGLSKSKTPGYSVFPIRDTDGEIPPGALKATTQVPAFAETAPADRIESHYADLPRKACMQCHLWSEGRAVRGRVGLDGDYRAEGCAACHVTYADDGRSRSGDPTIDKLEPGHPLQHRFTSKIPTATCARCHYGDASIGISFQGMAQLVPGMPAGPDVPGTTGKLHNGVFYQNDPDQTPPDVHHQRGLHCIDCHTAADTMGDGNLWPQMDHAVEIECESCHGTFTQVTDLLTSRGRRVPNLERDGDAFFLRSKVTGKRHPVVQVAHIVDQKRPEYNARAAAAMTPVHGRLECYTCHAGWNVDFFGFHFDRNEQFTQLDLLSGKRTPGRVTTQEKVFATFHQLRAGINHEARIAPYMVGFSTIGSARDSRGETILHQTTPVTSDGLSGVTLVPHQPHTTQPVARECVECHRTGVTWGLGSDNFRLVRAFAWALAPRGLVALAIDSRQLARSQPFAELELPGDHRALAIRSDPTHGHATHAYVATAAGQLHVVDLGNPTAPKLVETRDSLADPRAMLVAGDWLYVADGVAGLRILDLQKPASPRPVGKLPSIEARHVALAWPWAYVADGPGGLLIADVSDSKAPRALASVDLNGGSGSVNDATAIATLFQYSRTKALDELGARIGRTRARNLAFVACGLDGVRIVDVTEPATPQVLQGQAHQRAFAGDRPDVRGIAVRSQFDLGTAGGAVKSRERDVLFMLEEYGPDDNRQRHVRTFDVTDPLAPTALGERQRVTGGSGSLRLFSAYHEPFLQHFVVATGAGGLGTVLDATRLQTGLQPATIWDDVDGVRDLVFEQFAFDRLQDERGRPEKDIAHDGCRYLTPAEILPLLRTPVPVGREAEGRYGELQRQGTTTTERGRK
ncbi:MAG: hypothetical protein IPK26_12200 [Planctomycetes bacterium]|nr:hypothetical protein [Planctomycetota bacterium]